MKSLQLLTILALAAGCGGAQPRATPPVTATVTSQTTAGGEHGAGQPPQAAGFPVQGAGWSASLPGEWSESTSPQGTTQWTAVITPDRPERRVFSVQTIHGSESFEEVIQMLPERYRQDGAEPSAPRVFERQGRRVAEFTVHTPQRVQQIPMYTAILVEGRRGVVITCVGESGDGLERLCRGVINGVWFGADAAAQPRNRAPAGSQWIGGQGRYVPVPEAWRPAGNHEAGGTEIAVADEGEHHAVNLILLNDLQGTPEQAIEGGRRAATEDRANTITHTEPIRAGRRVGLFLEGSRASSSGVDVMLFQWVVAVEPGTFMAIACAGPTDDVGAHGDLYRAALESFTVTAR